MAFEGHPHLLAAQKAYRTFVGPVGADWKELEPEEQARWINVAVAAVRAWPAPVHGEFHLHLGHPQGLMVPIVRNFRADANEKSVHEECVSLEKWILETTKNYLE